MSGKRFRAEKIIGMLRETEVSLAQDKKVGEACRSLWGIDCPETRQDFGTKAKQITSILVFAKVVEVDPVTTDRYRRTVALVRVGDTVVNEELIRQGPARVFTRYCDRASCELWERLEDEAREPGGDCGLCRMPYRRESSGEVEDDAGTWTCLA